MRLQQERISMRARLFQGYDELDPDVFVLFLRTLAIICTHRDAREKNKHQMFIRP